MDVRDVLCREGGAATKSVSLSSWPGNSRFSRRTKVIHKSLKCCVMSQVDEPHAATGVPQLAGSGEPCCTSAGMLERFQRQTEILCPLRVW